MPDNSALIGDIAFRWWVSIGNGEKGVDLAINRAAKAALRRCRVPLDVCAVPAGTRFTRDMSAAGLTDNMDRILAVPAILSHVDTNVKGMSFGVYLAHEINGRPLISASAFQRLLQDRDDELIDSIRRIVDKAGNRAPVSNLATAIVGWNDPANVRQLTLDYFGAFKPALVNS